MMHALMELQRATLNARTSLAEPTIGTRVSGGKVQIVRVTYNPDGSSNIAELSAWLPLQDAVAALYAMTRPLA